jgi:hypothetical protein
MTTRHVVASVALALSVLFLARVNSAQASDVTDLIGGACVPDSATVRAGVYETAGFGIRFGGNGIGRLRLFCPYHLHSDAFGRRIGITMLSVIDQDGMEVGARVRANLRRAALGSNVAISIGTCDSNTSSITGPHNMACFLPSYTTKINESYWWEVLIERTNPRVNVELLSVGMRYYASAQNTMTSGRPPIVLRPDQCNEVWGKAVTKSHTPAQAEAAPEIVNFAQVDDFAQVDINNDGTIDNREFEVACGKGVVHAPLQVKE